MNLPNKITIFRVLLIPVFVVLLMVDSIPYYNFLALAVFSIACITDFIDGYIARKYNLVTNFGKFMDPLADKVLVCTAMILLIELGQISSVVVAIIMAREFIISGFRLVASDNGVVIAASYIAKFKTTAQMIMCILMLFTVDESYDNAFFSFIDVMAQVFMWIALVLTIASLVDYIYKNRQVLKEK
ncbi:MAG: CDP-diacylglycerol--glycerol-3-phosphate 3-phosphatidyltransferase [Lachnospiraceae bacterium]|nr:CDP-diacylglycerol--glycerol-3-phosphate 3-phosphatidyltransferase [Lachnospiraceae bacterium]